MINEQPVFHTCPGCFSQIVAGEFHTCTDLSGNTFTMPVEEEELKKETGKVGEIVTVKLVRRGRATFKPALADELWRE